MGYAPSWDKDGVLGRFPMSCPSFGVAIDRCLDSSAT
jgi:hypothetical protein